ncbi:MAG TPA: hypothetical protein VFF06_37020 [Polyangia bacterium]|nr:hypothetical protein [Polyangia bacterium]
MARPRKSDAVISGIVEQFAKQLSGALSSFISAHAAAVKTQGPGKPARKAGRRGGKRARVLCYYPGCKNLAAPRFGMFCASEHKDLSKADKEKYRALHSAKPVAAKRTKKK